jgi:hypothetical protein
LSSQSGILHATEAANTALLAGSLSLHLLGDLDVDLEELAHATVEADGLALVKVTLAVSVGDTLLSAGLDKTIRLLAHEVGVTVDCWVVYTGCTCPRPCQFRPQQRQSSLLKRAGGDHHRRGKTF